MEKDSLDESLNETQEPEKPVMTRVIFHGNEELLRFLIGECGTCIRGDNCKQRVDLSRGYGNSQTKFDSTIIKRGEDKRIDCGNYQIIYGLM